MPFRSSPLTASCALLLVSGLAHGLWTARWQTAQPLNDACARVAGVPAAAGAWQSTPVDVDPEPYQQAKALAYWMRRYTKEGTDSQITVILMCGQAKYMSVHTPDICYRGAGFEMVGEQKQNTIISAKSEMPGLEVSQRWPSAEFWSGRFRRPYKTSANQLHILWSWNSGNGWQAPQAPRSAFGREPFLYKLYVVREIPAETGSDTVTSEFLRTFLPVLENALFGDKRKRP